ncbi:MAG: lysozyme inhibitor LprI family protein [Paracoccaceae bacterium]
MIRLLIALALLSSAAAAQEIDGAQTLSRLRACYDPADTAESKRACMFTISEACQAEEEGGYSTLGMSMCNRAEHEAWDVLLNEEYKATMAAFTEMDADDAGYSENLDKRTDTLRAAQRAWMAYRDAECLNAYAIWGGGSMRHIAGTACYLRMTAERAIEIWNKREFMQ